MQCSLFSRPFTPQWVCISQPWSLKDCRGGSERWSLTVWLGQETRRLATEFFICKPEKESNDYAPSQVTESPHNNCENREKQHRSIAAYQAFSEWEVCFSDSVWDKQCLGLGRWLSVQEEQLLQKHVNLSSKPRCMWKARCACSLGMQGWWRGEDL